MKKFIKNNWLVIVIILLVFLYILKPTKNFIETHPDLEKSSRSELEYCKNIKNETTGEYLENTDEELKERCDNVIKTGVVKVDFYTMLTTLLFDIGSLNGMAFFIIIIPTLSILVKILKNNHIEYCLTRESYKDFMKTFLKKAYRYVWILPLLAAFLIFICVKHTSIDYKYSYLFSTSIWNENITKYPYLFMISYIFNSLIFSFIYINIGLLAVRKVHNYIKSLILSTIIIISIELFFEIILTYLIGTNVGVLFNMMNIYTFNVNIGYIYSFAFSISMLLISFISVYLTYKNKETLIIDCEKNK